MSNVREVVLNDWESFEEAISRFFESLEKKREGAGTCVSAPLFRGHADKRLRLLTTLERFSRKPQSVKEYYRILVSVAPAVASLTGKAWPISPDLDVDESAHGPPPGYEFMIYLRHHGFPSPLLDWSVSPYVAAFFAFAPRPPESCDGVAIYAYVEYLGQGKEFLSDRARIIGLGPYAVTHERHYAQQSQYTICKKEAKGDRFIFGSSRALSPMAMPWALREDASKSCLRHGPSSPAGDRRFAARGGRPARCHPLQQEPQETLAPPASPLFHPPRNA